MVDGFHDRWINRTGEGLTVCVVASSPALLAGLRSLLNDVELIETIYELSTLEEIDPYLSNTDLLILAPGFGSDIDLGEILELAPEVGVLSLAADEFEQNKLLGVIADHPWGILPLEASSEQIEAAIRSIAAGLSVGPPTLLNFSKGETPAGLDTEIIEPLTDRELEVLQQLAEGLANKQIALKLSISEHTVKFHVSSIYAKLGVANRTEAVRMGVRRGLILL